MSIAIVIAAAYRHLLRILLSSFSPSEAADYAIAFLNLIILYLWLVITYHHVGHVIDVRSWYAYGIILRPNRICDERWHGF
jgi:hypothetical protein